MFNLTGRTMLMNVVIIIGYLFLYKLLVTTLLSEIIKYLSDSHMIKSMNH